jgi:hypothetical protein
MFLAIKFLFERVNFNPYFTILYYKTITTFGQCQLKWLEIFRLVSEILCVIRWLQSGPRLRLMIFATCDKHLTYYFSSLNYL